MLIVNRSTKPKQKEFIVSTLKEALKPKATAKSTGAKNPAYYARLKNLFIEEMANSVNETTRIEVAGSEFVPAGTLKSMLVSELDTDVLRIVLMNPRTPLKAIIEFTNSDHAKVFNDDEEIVEYLKSRVSATDAE